MAAARSRLRPARGTGGPSGWCATWGPTTGPPPRVRVVDGGLRCLARQGIAKTTVDDMAREAGVSRATLYRTFPGGKEGVLAAVVETEVARLFSALAVAMGEAHDLEDVLVAGMVEAARRLAGHPALRYLLAHEPDVVLPHLAFDRWTGSSWWPATSPRRSSPAGSSRTRRPGRPSGPCASSSAYLRRPGARRRPDRPPATPGTLVRHLRHPRHPGRSDTAAAGSSTTASTSQECNHMTTDQGAAQ